MERKTHWAWPAFTGGMVAKDKLHIHLEHEWAVYVRDFPIMVGRAYVQCPIAEVRQELAENLYEEETGGLAAGKPHPELFMMYPQGLGMDVERFSECSCFRRRARIATFLDDVTTQSGLGGRGGHRHALHRRHRIRAARARPASPPAPQPALEEHPLAKHYGLPVECLALTKAHRSVEGEHRKPRGA